MARRHPDDFKLEVVRQLETGEKPLSQLCEEHDLSPRVVQGWKSRVEQHGPLAFQRRLRLSRHEAATRKIGELERQLEELSMENEFLKLVLQQIDVPLPRGRTWPS